jgi:hypothetical protein
MSPAAACADEIPKLTVEAKVEMETTIARPTLRLINFAKTIFLSFFEVD